MSRPARLIYPRKSGWCIAPRAPYLIIPDLCEALVTSEAGSIVTIAKKLPEDKPLVETSWFDPSHDLVLFDTTEHARMDSFYRDRDAYGSTIAYVVDVYKTSRGDAFVTNSPKIWSLVQQILVFDYQLLFDSFVDRVVQYTTLKKIHVFIGQTPMGMMGGQVEPQTSKMPWLLSPQVWGAELCQKLFGKNTYVVVDFRDEENYWRVYGQLRRAPRRNGPIQKCADELEKAYLHYQKNDYTYFQVLEAKFVQLWLLRQTIYSNHLSGRPLNTELALSRNDVPELIPCFVLGRNDVENIAYPPESSLKRLASVITHEAITKAERNLTRVVSSTQTVFDEWGTFFDRFLGTVLVKKVYHFVKDKVERREVRRVLQQQGQTTVMPVNNTAEWAKRLIRKNKENVARAMNHGVRKVRQINEGVLQAFARAEEPEEPQELEELEVPEIPYESESS